MVKERTLAYPVWSNQLLRGHNLCRNPKLLILLWRQLYTAKRICNNHSHPATKRICIILVEDPTEDGAQGVAEFPEVGEALFKRRWEWGECGCEDWGNGVDNFKNVIR